MPTNPNAGLMLDWQQEDQHRQAVARAARLMKVQDEELRRHGYDFDGRPLPAPGSAAAMGVQNVMPPSLMAPTMPQQARPPATPQPIGVRLPVGNAVAGSAVPGLYESAHTTPILNDPSIVRGAPSRYTLRSGAPPVPRDQPTSEGAARLAAPRVPFVPGGDATLRGGAGGNWGTPPAVPLTPAPLPRGTAQAPTALPSAETVAAATGPGLGPNSLAHTALAAPVSPAVRTAFNPIEKTSPYVYDPDSGHPVPGWAQPPSSPLDVAAHAFPGAAAAVGSGLTAARQAWNASTQGALWNAPVRRLPKQKLRERVLPD